MAVLVKNAAVEEGYCPVASAGMIAAGVKPCSPLSRTRGLSNCCCCIVVYVREGDLGLWLTAYLATAARGRYRSVLIGTAIATYVTWLVLPPGGSRAYDDQRRHCLCFGRSVSTNHGPSTAETSLYFRGSADKRPTKKGTQPITDKIHGPLAMLSNICDISKDVHTYILVV